MSKITVSHIEHISDGLPCVFDGYRILHISDLHNRSFGERQQPLLDVIKKIAPDAVFITGDLIDSYRTNVEDALWVVRHALKYSSVYYAAGNHEQRYGQYQALAVMLKNEGAKVLDDRVLHIARGEKCIVVAGVKDPKFSTNSAFEAKVNELDKMSDAAFKMLLSHKPRMKIYRQTSFDLVFCGHAHGGLMRLPFGKALYAPEQGFLPKHTSGMHSENGVSMVVSRGLGNTGKFPFRLFNPPEIVVVTLRSKSIHSDE